jgi:hypothetical protein
MDWASSNKTEQLNADDLIGGPLVITIERVDVKPGDEAPLWIFHNDDKGRSYKPCLTVRKLLKAGWGTQTAEWVGRKMQLYRDPSITFGRDKIGGIRVSHMTDIGDGITEKLMVTRGKRKEFNVMPLIVNTFTFADIAPLFEQDPVNSINYLYSIGWLKEGQTPTDLAQEHIDRIAANPTGFAEQIVNLKNNQG